MVTGTASTPVGAGTLSHTYYVQNVPHSLGRRPSDGLVTSRHPSHGPDGWAGTTGSQPERLGG